jgi:hypothetical protein
MILCWIDAFLSSCFQYVRIDSCVSGLRRVISGVPHGSVLRSVLFIIYVNDITECIAPSITVKLFTDDTKLYTVIANDNADCAQLQHNLDSIASWAEHWQLKLSSTKCVVMRMVHHGVLTLLQLLIQLDVLHYVLLINVLILKYLMKII